MHHFDAAYEMLHGLSSRYEAECEFLRSVAPIISHRRKDADLEKVHSEIVINCERFGLHKTSLIMLCTLSCLYERNDGEEPLIGRKIIKPTDSYSYEDAHNAISDLRALEMLAAINGLNIGCVAFCTRDKHLAALWCGLNISSPKWLDSQFTCSIEPDVSLFPRLSETDVAELVQELND
ncbi:hypothetical protein [Thiolapillus brandeum]|uniref:hypothetical protein n=1 Tax=Thiolapillus brandeum TaxID=1076588 RepID=UPI001184EC05|nr:hypothetical protein [Thiolapillus brandeum]